VHGYGVIGETNSPRRVEGGQDVVEGGAFQKNRKTILK
jgi:hypothetical protein